MREGARALVVGAALLIGTLCSPAPASAYDGQLGVSLEAGYAFASSGIPPHGVYAELGVEVGLGDVWALRGRVGYAYHPEPTQRWVGGLEIIYLVDVYELVPYLGLGVDGLATLTNDVATFDFGAHGVVGVDFVVSRDFVFGILVRPTVVVTSWDTSPLWLEAGARVEWLFPI